MMKNRKFKTGFTVALCIALGVFTVVLAEPGTADDPLISKSYIENQVIPRLERYIESRITDIKSGNSSGGSSDSFRVIEASAGQEIICGAGAELVLRMGKATVIAPERGGLADTTSGYDLANGANMPPNHLLIVPLGDGRGVKAQDRVMIMIKGDYTVR